MWAAGVVILEMYAGGLAGLKEARGDYALDLLETCARHTTDVPTPGEDSGGVLTPKSSENTRQHEGGGRGDAGAAGQDGEQSGAKGGMGSGSSRGNGGAKRRITFRVAMPGGVLAVLQDIFQQEAGDRPESMEVRRSPFCRVLWLILAKSSER